MKKCSDADADEEALLFEEEAGSQSSKGEEEEDLTDVHDSEPSSEGEEEEDLTDVQDSESEMICQLTNLKKARWRQVKYHKNEIIHKETASLRRIYSIIK